MGSSGSPLEEGLSLTLHLHMRKLSPGGHICLTLHVTTLQTQTTGSLVWREEGLGDLGGITEVLQDFLTHFVP